MPSEIKFEIVKQIRVLNPSAPKTTKEINIVKWGNLEPSYDIRKWNDDVPGKGISLNKEEARELMLALQEEFANEE